MLKVDPLNCLKAVFPSASDLVLDVNETFSSLKLVMLNLSLSASRLRYLKTLETWGGTKDQVNTPCLPYVKYSWVKTADKDDFYALLIFLFLKWDKEMSQRAFTTTLVGLVTANECLQMAVAQVLVI